MDQIDRKALLKGFPEGASIPKDLIRAFDYGEDKGGLVVGDFALVSYIGTSVEDWFQEDARMVARFAGFGRDRLGSLYGYWLEEGGRDLSKAPIGYLSAESKCENTVLANSLPELLTLLTIGVRGLGEVENWEESAKEGACSDLAAYRRWVKREFGIAPLKDFGEGRALVGRARKQHPDLQEWTNAWVRRGRKT